MHHQPAEISDDQLRESIRSLNEKQHQAYDIVLSWCRDKMKNLNCMKPKKVEPIYLYLSLEVVVQEKVTLLRQSITL